MITLHGKSVFGGIAIGPMSMYRRAQHKIKRYRVEDPQAEILRFHSAKETTLQKLDALHQRALQEVGESGAMIFEIHQMMLEDLDYCDSIENIILTQSVNAEYAVGTTADNFSQMFLDMDDDYMRARASDVKDVSEQLLETLSGSSSSLSSGNDPVILFADDLAPSETVQLEKNKILAFLTMHGSANSHTAILARTMGIPAIVSLGDSLKPEYDGKTAIVDGFTGTLYLDPDAELLEKMKKLQKEESQKRQLLQALRGKENVTLDGQKIEIYANIGNSTDVGAAVQNDAGGIGLFRSEFLYLENDDYPTEDQQFAVYKTVAEKMAGKKVIIRTLDIGADKQADYFHLPKEENPALGYRAIRICLQQPDIFKTQLRALYRASAFGKIAIMFPMITSLQEIHDIKTILEEVKSELRKDAIPFREDVEIGIMIETPAAALISGNLAKEVDFFSVGTNDLTQYTLAIDRQNPKLDRFYDPHHPAVLQLIRMAVENAHANGIWIGICGELGADLALTETFLSYGIDELSVSPSMILPLRKKVRETTLK